MSACTDRLYPISAESLDEAMSELARRAAHYQEGFRLLMAIKTRSGLVGRIFDRRSVEAVQKAVGAGYAVTYYIRDYSNGHPRTLRNSSTSSDSCSTLPPPLTPARRSRSAVSTAKPSYTRRSEPPPPRSSEQEKNVSIFKKVC